MEQDDTALDFLAQRLPVRDLTAEAGAGLLPEYVSDTRHGDDSGCGSSAVFSAAARVLFRKDRRHLLITGWKGVGKTSAVVEFARLAAAGEFQFLRDHRCLWLDATHVGPEDSRSCLETILLAAKTLRPVILCLDGIHALLRRPNAGSNKPLLRAGLQDPLISVIGVLPRWECNELFSTDAEMLELFDRIELEEPDEAVAVQVVESAAQRLATQYKLSITPQAIRRAVFLSSNELNRVAGQALNALRFPSHHPPACPRGSAMTA